MTMSDLIGRAKQNKRAAPFERGPSLTLDATGTD
jgi:hypothetical protein